MADTMWAFPKGKPQWFASSPVALAWATLAYPLVRSTPRIVRAAAVVPIALPVSRNRLTERAPFSIPCGEAWPALRAELVGADAGVRSWVFFQSQWRVQRFAAMGIDRLGRPRAFVAVMLTDARTFHPLFRSPAVHIPAIVGEATSGGWTGRSFELLPRLTQTPTRSWDRIRAVAGDVSTRLAGEVEKPAGTPAHWRPMHGDFTPSNLREDRRGELWLIDWEEATWAPPVADVVRYAMTRQLDAHERVGDVVHAVAADIPAPADAVAEAARYWLTHRNFVLDTGEGDALTPGKAEDLARGRRTRDLLEGLAALVH